MIDKIKSFNINDEIKSIYEFDEYTLTELLCKFNDTINDIIENKVVTTRSGAKADRPTDGLYTGMQYLDTSLGTNGKVIWWNGTNWIDAMGNIV